MWDILHKYGHDYKLVFVGDESMSAYEISHPGGSVEHFNEEAGAVWIKRMDNVYHAAVWLSPVPEARSEEQNVCTPVTNAHLVCRLLPGNKKLHILCTNMN